MKAVGIKVLKDNLSRYLRAVREGETVYVTDRDTVIAEIRRPSAPPTPSNRWQRFLRDQGERQAVQPASVAGGAPLARLSTTPVRRRPPPTDLQTILDAIKAES